MRSISRMTGFSPAVLRAWEQRHAVLDPERAPSGHRLYTEKDLTVLRSIRVLLDAGRSIGEIARMGRPALLSRQPPQSSGKLSGDFGELRKELIAAVVRIDLEAVDRLLDQALAMGSAPAVVEQLIEPGLVEIGELWAQGTCSVAGEHLFSARIQQRLANLLSWANCDPGPTVPRLLSATFPDEQHQLGMLCVAFRLARQGRRIVHLGPALPFEDLERAIQQLQPEVVLLSVTRGPLFAAHRPAFLALLLRWQGQLRFVLGGVGVPEHDAELEAAGLQICRDGSIAGCQSLMG